MIHDFVLAGELRRDYLLPPSGRPLLDVPGGNLLYAAGGLRVWEDTVALLARVGEDYPREWLRQVESRGLSTAGVQIAPAALDLRQFMAYTDLNTVHRTNPVSHFARLGLPFPKQLLGYQPSTDQRDNRTQPIAHAPRPADIPAPLFDARAVHLAPLDFVSHTQLVGAFRTGNAHTITIDPAPGYMTPSFIDDLRSPLRNLTAFLPSEEELRTLFWGRSTDLWEMAATLGSFGCDCIVIKRGARGQALYITASKKKYEIPAYTARVVDVTGAGDAFCGGFLAGYLRTLDPLQATLFGNIAASFAIEGSGPLFPLDAMPGLAQARLESLRDIVREV